MTQEELKLLNSGAIPPSLRDAAEAFLEKSGAVSPLQSQDVKQLLHELSVYHVELQIQNEELREAQQALEQSHTKYLLLFDQAPTPYVSLNSRGFILEANQAASKLSGIPIKDLKGKLISTLISTEDHILFLQHLQLAFERGRHTFQCRFERASGTRRIVVMSSQTYQLPNHDEPCALCNIVDVTPQVENSLRMKMLERAVECVASGVAIINTRQPSLPVVYANSAFERLCGLDTETILGKPLTAILGTETRPEELQKLTENVRPGRPGFLLTQMKRSGRETFWAELTLSPTPSSDGTSGHIVIILNDVTVRVESQQHLGQLAAIVESSLEAIIRLSRNGIIESWNQGAQLLFGISEPMAVGRSLTAFLPPDQVDRVLHQVRNAADRGSRHVAEQPMNRFNGEPIICLLAISPILDASEANLGVSLIARDVSELLKMGHEAEHHREEMKEFLTIAAHDLKRPLISIAGLMDLAREELNEGILDNVPEYLDLGLTENQRMLEMIKDLSRLAKQDQGEVFYKYGEINELIRRVIERFREQAQAKRIQIKVSELGEELRCELPTIELEQALENLIENAILHGCIDQSRPHHQIEVRSAIAKDRLQISVVDSGPGIPSDAQERIFRLFCRLNPQGSAPGTGVGLASTRKLMHRIGGSVEVDSKPGKGATFTLWVPIINTRLASDALPAAANGSDQ